MAEYEQVKAAVVRAAGALVASGKRRSWKGQQYWVAIGRGDGFHYVEYSVPGMEAVEDDPGSRACGCPFGAGLGCAQHTHKIRRFPSIEAAIEACAGVYAHALGAGGPSPTRDWVEYGSAPEATR